MLVSKTDLLVRVAKAEVNQVLNSPLIVSTRRVEPTTSKAMVSEEFSMLRDDRLHTSLCVMECSLIGLRPMNKPKPALSLNEGL